MRSGFGCRICPFWRGICTWQRPDWPFGGSSSMRHWTLGDISRDFRSTPGWEQHFNSPLLGEVPPPHRICDPRLYTNRILDSDRTMSPSQSESGSRPVIMLPKGRWVSEERVYDGIYRAVCGCCRLFSSRWWRLGKQSTAFTFLLVIIIVASLVYNILYFSSCRKWMRVSY